MPRALCFVDMPFGQKSDLASGTEIDFDQIYQQAIKPAIETVGLEAMRGDEEQSGGIIHAAMFARLLLAEFVVADLTLANPNVFYELGIRHAAKPFTTVPIFATTHALPFDVALIRAIPYSLSSGVLTDAEATKLRNAIEARLRQSINGPKSNDSPLFQLLPEFPGIDLPHEVTEAFQARVQHEAKFAQLLETARNMASNAERRTALHQLQSELGDLKIVQRNVLVDLMLSYRAVEAWDDIITLVDKMPDELQRLAIVRQQQALALNRRHQTGDRKRAVKILENLLKSQGPDPETLGILGRVHKDRYREAKAAQRIEASAALDDAINAYQTGFESDPRDYFPGVNAVTLLVEKGDDDALAQANRLAPLVSFAVARRGGAQSKDYWDLATVLELASIAGDWTSASGVLPRVIAAADESWKARTTHDNLVLLQQGMHRRGHFHEELDQYIGALLLRETELAGTNN